jgi:hypothetical protein
MAPEDWREFCRGLLWAVVWNLLAAAGTVVFANPAFGPSTKAWFYVMAAANELYGVVLIASPELRGPTLAALWSFRGWIDKMFHFAAARLRSMLRRPARIHRVSGTAGLNVETSMAAKKISRGPGDRSGDELIAWLVERTTEIDSDLQELRTHVQKLPAQWAGDVAAALDEAKAHAETLVRGVEHRNLVLRLLGVGFVLFGIMLGTVGNLL